MTKVDFYLIPETTRESCNTFACRLVEKAYQQKHQVYIHTNSQEEAKAIDDLLWTFRDISFIPHSLHGEISEPMPSVRIGFESHPTAPYDILINLTKEIPDFFNHFHRAIEIVAQEDSLKTNGRKKFKIYKDKGCELTTHDLTKNS